LTAPFALGLLIIVILLNNLPLDLLNTTYTMNTTLILSITTIPIFHENPLSGLHHPGLLQPHPLPSSHCVLKPRQYSRMMNSKPEDSWFIAITRFRGNKSWVDLEEDVVETAAEVGAVDTSVPGGFRVVDVFAFRAVEFYGAKGGVVGWTVPSSRIRDIQRHESKEATITWKRGSTHGRRG
jgi:hypothetical protein